VWLSPAFRLNRQVDVVLHRSSKIMDLRLVAVQWLARPGFQVKHPSISALRVLESSKRPYDFSCFYEAAGDSKPVVDELNGNIEHLPHCLIRQAPDMLFSGAEDEDPAGWKSPGIKFPNMGNQSF